MTSIGLVADTSVIVPWLKQNEEEFSSNSLQLFRDFIDEKIRIVVPQLFFYEITNFAVLGSKNERFPEAILKNLFELDFIVHELMPWNFMDIGRLAHEKKITVYDATYYYVAETLKVPLYTADEQLVRAWGANPGGHIRKYGLS